MIIVKMMGGLGNQMFQYSIFRILKEKGYETYLDLNWFDQYKSRDWVRPFKINEAFCLNEKGIQSKLLKKLKLWDSLIIRFIRKFIPIQNKIYKRKNTKVSFYTDFGPFRLSNLIDDLDFSRGAYLNGYWANAENYIQHTEFLKSIYVFDIPKNVVIEKLVNDIQNSNSISVHWRRGDFNPEDYLSEDYYLKALKKVNELINIDKVYIFSDSVNEVKQIVSDWEFNFELIFFKDILPGEEDYLEMYLMTKTKANIIANSTFSWWAAFLNTRKDNLIIYPKINSFKELAINDWIGIDK